MRHKAKVSVNIIAGFLNSILICSKKILAILFYVNVNNNRSQQNQKEVINLGAVMNIIQLSNEKLASY